MKQLLLSNLFIFLSLLGYAQTDVSGGIFTNTTWSVTGNPYIVTGPTVVFEDVTLTIEPGVIVKFDAGLNLELRGKLIAIGDSINQITFTSNSPSPAQSDWDGILAIGTTSPVGVGDQITMEYCIAEYAHIFVNLDLAYHGPYIFKNCYFAHNFQTNEDGGMPFTLFENCTFESNHTALTYCQFESSVINSTFINNVNGVDGIKEVESCYFSGHSGVALSPYGMTQNCIVENNNIGVSCAFNSVNHVFINNIVRDNSYGVDILTFFNGSIDFTGNEICRNYIYNVELFHDNNADLSFNCWCSTDSAFIRSTIFDGYVDISYGLVDFSPFTSDCADTPIDTTDTPIDTTDTPIDTTDTPIDTTDTPIDSTSTSLDGEDILDEVQDAIIFPNPFRSTLNIIRASSEPAEISFFTIDGKKVLQKRFTDRISINTEEFLNGFYYYELHENGNFIQNGKLLKTE